MKNGALELQVSEYTKSRALTRATGKKYLFSGSDVTEYFLGARGEAGKDLGEELALTVHYSRTPRVTIVTGYENENSDTQLLIEPAKKLFQLRYKTGRCMADVFLHENVIAGSQHDPRPAYFPVMHHFTSALVTKYITWAESKQENTMKMYWQNLKSCQRPES